MTENINLNSISIGKCITMFFIGVISHFVSTPPPITRCHFSGHPSTFEWPLNPVIQDRNDVKNAIVFFEIQHS